MTSRELATGVPPLRPPTASQPSADLPRGVERLLLVEDEALVRSLVASQLRGLGYAVLEAADALQALDMLALHGPVSLMIADLTLPGGFDGARLAAEAVQHHPELKVLLVSGKFAGDSGARPDAVAMLAKPFRRADLAHAVRACLDVAQPGRENAPAASAAEASSKGPCEA